MFIVDEAVELEVSKKKIATQEQVDETHAGVKLGHNSIGGSTLETVSEARGMIVNFGGGGAFGDLAATLPDVTILLPEDVGEEEGVEEKAVEDDLQPPWRWPKRSLMGAMRSGPPQAQYWDREGLFSHVIWEIVIYLESGVSPPM